MPIKVKAFTIKSEATPQTMEKEDNIDLPVLPMTKKLYQAEVLLSHKSASFKGF